ncbi:unnamed protein product [Rhodiola kirilowii]
MDNGSNCHLYSEPRRWCRSPPKPPVSVVRSVRLTEESKAHNGRGFADVKDVFSVIG